MAKPKGYHLNSKVTKKSTTPHSVSSRNFHRAPVPFEGYSTPIVKLLDYKNNLILDSVLYNPDTQEEYPVAIQSFTFEFNEKKEDECSIVLSSNSLDFFNQTNLVVGKSVKVSWGYLNGDMRPPIIMVVVDITEKYHIEGYALSIKLSDTYATLSKGQSPMLMNLLKAKDELAALNSGVDVNLEILKRINSDPNYKDYIEYSTRVSVLSNISPTGSENEAIHSFEVAQDKLMVDLALAVGVDPNNIQRDYLRQIDYEFYSKNKPFLEKKLAEAERVWQEKYDNFMANEYPESTEAKAMRAKIGDKATIVANNLAGLMQDVADGSSSEPVQVTCHDGQLVTYNKVRAISADPIAEYTFKGEDGRLLEFTYDTNSKYSDETNVLRQLKMNPETGEITQTDYLADKTYTDVYSREEEQYASDREAVLQSIKGAILNEVSISQYTQSLQDPSLSAIGPDGKSVPIAVTGYTQDIGNAASEAIRGVVKEYRAANDNIITPAFKRTMNITDAYSDLPQWMENMINKLKVSEGEAVKATARLMGDPQLISGKTLIFRGLSKQREGKYFLTSCAHTITAQGYIITTEMYKVGGLPITTMMVKTNTSKEEIKKKADGIKIKKIELSPDYETIKERGYVTVTDLRKTEEDLEREKLDRDWAAKSKGIIYEVTFKEDAASNPVTYKIKIPQLEGIQKDLWHFIGYEDLYRLFQNEIPKGKSSVWLVNRITVK